jgi:adenylate cyclase
MNQDRIGRAERDVVVGFLDLSFYTRDAARTGDAGVAEVVSEYYARVGARVQAAGGTVVKYIGDGVLIVFDGDRADAAAGAVLALREEIDGWMRSIGWESRLVVKLHAGTVIAGSFGAPGSERFDVIGGTVNVAARLPRPFHVSPQVFRRLSPPMRQRFKKHTPPITYIPTEDRHA